MDPLSLVASILTIGATMGVTLRALRSAQNAPVEVQALANEVTDIMAVVRDIEAALVESQLHQNAPSSLVSLLEKAHAKILDLDAIIKLRLENVQQGTQYAAQIPRFSWLRERPRVRRFQQELREIRLNLVATLGVTNLYSAFIPL
jgi:hypothetical protein